MTMMITSNSSASVDVESVDESISLSSTSNSALSASISLPDCTSDDPIACTSNIAETIIRVDPPGKHERKCSSDDGIHYVDDDDGVEFALDAKHLNQVHEELEKLNIATDVINSLEFQLDESRMHFNQIHCKWTQRLEEMSKKYGSAIQKSRPYHEAVAEDLKIREEAQEAASRFKRANSVLHIAKLQVKLTQESLARQKVVEPECLEVLNQHIQRVSEAEHDRAIAEEFHRALSQRMIASANKIKEQERQHPRAIKKSLHYFELRQEFQRIMDHQKSEIARLEKEVKQKKNDYTTSLTNLEQISNSIHEERSLSSVKRGNVVT
ncbi:SH3 domain-binding protein 5 (SH3BP5) domain-containing protein [Ditylenchus destructor]|nr:SH3 domain-binding protein 5 (SH3BP5) domain-containing protein [Ditylenchus destructor]